MPPAGIGTVSWAVDGRIALFPTRTRLKAVPRPVAGLHRASPSTSLDKSARAILFAANYSIELSRPQLAAERWVRIKRSCDRLIPYQAHDLTAGKLLAAVKRCELDEKGNGDHITA